MFVGDEELLGVFAEDERKIVGGSPGIDDNIGGSG